MVPIKIQEFAKKYIETNKDEKLDDVIKRLKESLKRKNSGAKCSSCKSSPIWALGSALGGFEGCFKCITCETDDSSDYEVI